MIPFRSSILTSLRVGLPPIVAFVVLVAAWEVAVRVSGVPVGWVAPPSAVARVSVERSDELLGALWRTTEAALIGFGLSAAVGIAVGVLLSSTRLIERSFYPFTIFLQTVPLIAIAPLLVRWFGVGLTPVAISAFIASVFPVIANTFAGIRAVDPALRDLFRLYRAGPLSTLWKLKIPSALPHIFTGLRIAAGLAVIGTIVGEFTAATLEQGGLGPIILTAKRSFDMSMVFAAVVASSLLGLLLFTAVNLAARLVLRHRQ